MQNFIYSSEIIEMKEFKKKKVSALGNILRKEKVSLILVKVQNFKIESPFLPLHKIPNLCVNAQVNCFCKNSKLLCSSIK